MPEMLTIYSEALRSGGHRSAIRWGRKSIEGRLKKLVLFMEDGKDSEVLLILKPEKIDCRVKAIKSDDLLDKLVQRFKGKGSDKE